MDIFDKIARERTQPVSILHGTDWWTDCDDIAALRLLCRAHKKGLIRLECVGINSVMEYSAPSVSAFLDDCGVSAPIGVDRSAVRDGKNCRYQRFFADNYPHTVKSNDVCEDAAKLYRRVLANLSGKAIITEVGFEQIIMQLLKSGPDEISPLTGIELVKEKVSAMYLMAGQWDGSCRPEYNLCAYPVCSEAGDHISRYAPVPLYYLGFEVGVDVITGAPVPDGDMLKQGFIVHGSGNGRSSWDPMTVMAAIIGDPETAGYRCVCGDASIDPKTGVSRLSPRAGGRHCVLVKTQDNGFYADMINTSLY